jgi:hypothetical protein
MWGRRFVGPARIAERQTGNQRALRLPLSGDVMEMPSDNPDRFGISMNRADESSAPHYPSEAMDAAVSNGSSA